MRSAAMKSYLAKPGQAGGEWHLVNADGKVLGRLATQLATILMGKHKPTYTPHVLSGDFVVVINAEKVRVTGNKMEQMEYDRYSYYPSGRKVEPIKKVLAEHPERIIWWAVRRMLPKTALGRGMLSRLKIYAGPEHPHQAQQPKPLELQTSTHRASRGKKADKAKA
jgi:large subunit ribosomal protein L13